MWKEDKFWDSIWKHTVVKNQTIATNGTTSLEAGDLRIHLRNVVENKQIIATSVTMLVHNMAILESIWNTQRRKVKQMQPVWFCIYSGRQFEGTFENTQRRKVKQMQPMWLCLFWGRPFEGTFDDARWRKAKQVTMPLLRQAIWGDIWKRTVEEVKNATSEIAQAFFKLFDDMHKLKQLIWLCLF